MGGAKVGIVSYWLPVPVGFATVVWGRCPRLVDFAVGNYGTFFRVFVYYHFVRNRLVVTFQWLVVGESPIGQKDNEVFDGSIGMIVWYLVLSTAVYQRGIGNLGAVCGDVRILGVFLLPLAHGPVSTPSLTHIHCHCWHRSEYTVVRHTVCKPPLIAVGLA